MESERSGRRYFSNICLAAAIIHVLAALLICVCVRQGHLGHITLIGLLHFVPSHLVLWRFTCLLNTMSSLLLIAFAIGYREIVDRRYHTSMTIAMFLIAIGVTQDLNGQFSIMVVFPNLASLLSVHGSFLYHQTLQLTWSALNQWYMQSVLQANLLFGIAWFLIVGSMLATKIFPKWIAWSGMPIVALMLSCAAFALLGDHQVAPAIVFILRAYMAVWFALLGLFADAKKSPA
jgi:hypothetical protein